jgi:hypothetical protein
VFQSGTNEYAKLPELRTRLFSLGQEGFIVTKLPSDTAIASLQYRRVEKRLVVIDGGTFSLDINEFGGSR